MTVVAFLYAGFQVGARTLCLHISLIHNAKLHKLDPYKYCVEIMRAVPQYDNAGDYEELLPWDIDLIKVTSNDR